MALTLKKEIAENSFLLFWEIKEDLETLINSLVRFGYTPDELDPIAEFKNDQRKSEWLATRVLASDFFCEKTLIHYDDFGKPFLTNGYNISISHTKELVVVALSATSIIGIDTEVVSDKIGRVALKFLHKTELENIDIEKDILKLYLHWCAKEALYKVYGKKNLNFIDNLKIDPIEDNKGYFTGHIISNNENKSYQMQYFDYKGYLVVWTSK